MTSRLSHWSRVAFAAAASSLALGLLVYFVPMFGSSSESKYYSTVAATERVWQILLVFSGLANATAFGLALASSINADARVPWFILIISGIGVCYCCALVYFLIFGDQ